MTTVEEHTMTHHIERRQRTERLHILTRSKQRDVLIGWSAEDSVVTETPVTGPGMARATTTVPTSESATLPAF